MRILVTGASGLLGINLALEAAKDHTVFGVVNHRKLRLPGEQSHEGLPFKPFTVVQADLLEPGAPERLLAETCPDWVIHCAALAEVDQCESNPELARQLNSDLPGKLAALCANSASANSGDVARGGARFLHVSTDAVFDGQRGSYTEDDIPNPLSVYARTKLDGERAVAHAYSQAAIVRVNLFGWSLTGGRSLGEFFFYNLGAGRRVNGFTDVYFCPLLANELAQVLLKMLAAGLSGLYHAVSGECLSKYEFGLRLAHRFGLDETLITAASVAQGGLKAARSPNLTLRNDKLAQALGEPLPSVSTGLQGLFTLYQQGYPQLLKRLVSGEQ